MANVRPLPIGHSVRGSRNVVRVEGGASVKWLSGPFSSRVSQCSERAGFRVPPGLGLVGVVAGVVDEVVEDSAGVVDGLVVGHRRLLDPKLGVVVLVSERCACVCDGVPLGCPSASGTPFGGDPVLAMPSKTAASAELVEAGEDLDATPDARKEDRAFAALMGSLDSFVEVTRGVGKVAGAQTHACGQIQGKPEGGGARGLARERDALVKRSKRRVGLVGD